MCLSYWPQFGRLCKCIAACWTFVILIYLTAVMFQTSSLSYKNKLSFNTNFLQHASVNSWDRKSDVLSLWPAMCVCPVIRALSSAQPRLMRVLTRFCSSQVFQVSKNFKEIKLWWIWKTVVTKHIMLSVNNDTILFLR